MNPLKLAPLPFFRSLSFNAGDSKEVQQIAEIGPASSRRDVIASISHVRLRASGTHSLDRRDTPTSHQAAHIDLALFFGRPLHRTPPRASRSCYTLLA